MHRKNQKSSWCALIALLISFCFFLWACESSAAEKMSDAPLLDGRLLITGSSTMCPLVAEIGKRFEFLHPTVRVDVECGGSGKGINDAREGKADIGMASRPLGETEQELFAFPIARDGVSIILHKKNPLKSLSDAQVADIFTGKITDWKKVGGRKAPVTVVSPAKGYASVELFTSYFKIKYEDIKADVLVGDNPERIKAVIQNPNAIAFVSSGEAERAVEDGIQIKLLPVSNVMPTKRNIITGNYPISRPLSFVTKDLPSGIARTFIEYCLSPAVVDLIESYSFVPYED